MGTSAYGGKGFQERIRVSGERPIGAASFRQHSIRRHATPAPYICPQVKERTANYIAAIEELFKGTALVNAARAKLITSTEKPRAFEPKGTFSVWSKEKCHNQRFMGEGGCFSSINTAIRHAKPYQVGVVLCAVQTAGTPRHKSARLSPFATGWGIGSAAGTELEMSLGLGPFGANSPQSSASFRRIFQRCRQGDRQSALTRKTAFPSICLSSDVDQHAEAMVGVQHSR